MAMTEEEKKQLEDAKAEVERLKSLGLTQEQMTRELEDLKSRFTSTTQENAQLRQNLDALIERERKSSPKPGEKRPDPVDDPEGYAEWVERRARAAADEERRKHEQEREAREKAARQVEETRRLFFSKYPHLARFPAEVQHCAMEVLKVATPDMTVDQQFKLVAEETEKYIKERFGDKVLSQQPPHVGSGKAPEPPAPPAPEVPPAYDPQKETDEAINEMRSARDRASTPPRAAANP